MNRENANVLDILLRHVDIENNRVLPKIIPSMHHSDIDSYFYNAILVDNTPQTIGYDTGQSIGSDQIGKFDWHKMRNAVFYYDETREMYIGKQSSVPNNEMLAHFWMRKGSLRRI